LTQPPWRGPNGTPCGDLAGVECLFFGAVQSVHACVRRSSQFYLVSPVFSWSPGRFPLRFPAPLRPLKGIVHVFACGLPSSTSSLFVFVRVDEEASFPSLFPSRVMTEFGSFYSPPFRPSVVPLQPYPYFGGRLGLIASHAF